MQDEINSTLSNAGKKASKMAKNLANKAEDLESEAMGGARQTLNRLTEGVGDMASDYLSSFNQSPLGFVRQYPVQAAIGGVILGFILGSAVSRKAVTE